MGVNDINSHLEIGPEEAKPVLAAVGLCKEFQGFVAVRDVNLTVRSGSIHALIGPNGAGKTTCFNLLTKFLTPTRGKIFYNGEDITSLSPSAVARKGVVRSFQISSVFPRSTVLENVRVALQRRRSLAVQFWRSDSALQQLNEEALDLLLAVGLERYSDQYAGELSYGRKRALEIATTLALKPDVMLLDEPMAGMAHEDVGGISDLIRKMAKGRTVLMVEHNLSVVSALCDQVTVLQRGEIIAQGAYEEVSNNPRVREAYMGADVD